jgi:hypothetical protein
MAIIAIIAIKSIAPLTRDYIKVLGHERGSPTGRDCHHLMGSVNAVYTQNSRILDKPRETLRKIGSP